MIFAAGAIALGVATILWIGAAITDRLTPVRATAGTAHDVNLDALAKRYAPILIWSADGSPELFRPIAAEDFLAHTETSGDNLKINKRVAGAYSANGWQGERAYFCELANGQEPTATTTIPNCQSPSTAPSPPTVYVRTVKSGAIGWYALEYWLLYFDDYWSRHDPVDVPQPVYQTHEGDWEEITILLNGRRRPRVIIYSQHGAGEVRPWATATASFGVEYAAGHPLAFVARGSHAEYFSAGAHPIDPQLIAPALALHPALRNQFAAANLRDFALANSAPACSLFSAGLTLASGPGIDAPGYPAHCQTPYRIGEVTDRSPLWNKLAGTWGTDHRIELPGLGLLSGFINRRDGPPQGPPFQGPRWRDPWDAAANWCSYADSRRPQSVESDRAGYPICHVSDTRLPRALWVPPQPPSWWTIGYRIFGGAAVALGLVAAIAAGRECRSRWQTRAG